MGRKIPGKKHRGVKDPEQQRAVRYHSIKDKINAPPKDVDQQDIPYSLKKIINFKERLKEGKVSLKRKKNKSQSKLISTEPRVKQNKVKRLHANSDPAPAFIQQKGETDRRFMHRVNTIVENVLKESKFEQKYGVKVRRHYETGEIVDVAKQPKDELRELVKKAKIEQKQKGKKKKKAPDEPRLTKSQKKSRKLAQKKANKELNKVVDFDDYKDTVQFGEIVHAPPTLVTPKRVNKMDGAPRPGRKDLLLKSVINKNDKSKLKIQSSSTKKTVFDKIQGDGKVNKKGKRKDLPQGVRRQLETQQKEIVSAYRMLKAKKEKIPT